MASPEKLTDLERDILTQLAEVTNKYFALAGYRHGEQQEWVHTMHILQRQISSRVAHRTNPDLLTPFSQPPITFGPLPDKEVRE